MSEKPTNNGELMVKRDENGRVLPGSVLNPNGKPLGAKHMTTKLFEALQQIAKDKDGEPDKDGKTYADKLVERIIIETVGKGNTALIQMVYDRLDGKPDQGINMNVTGEMATNTTDVMEIAKRVSDELKKKKTS